MEKDKTRVNEYMRVYKQEEMDSMNYILGKDINNKIFTQFELEALSKIDLFNRKVVYICKEIWANKDNEIELKRILKYIGVEVNI